jgi:hypothetical protein
MGWYLQVSIIEFGGWTPRQGWVREFLGVKGWLYLLEPSAHKI